MLMNPSGEIQGQLNQGQIISSNLQILPSNLMVQPNVKFIPTSSMVIPDQIPSSNIEFSSGQPSAPGCPSQGFTNSNGPRSLTKPFDLNSGLGACTDSVVLSGQCIPAKAYHHQYPHQPHLLERIIKKHFLMKTRNWLKMQWQNWPNTLIR